MCDNNCQNEKNKILNILEKFECLNDIIDEIREDYNNKQFIGKITTLIANSNEFIYYGGPPKYKIESKSRIDNLNNFRKEMDYSSHYNYWLKCKKEHEEMPNEINTHCLCFNCIKNLCFIKNIKTEKLYTIGIECINKFINNRRTCSICSKSHRNSKDNYCKDCRFDIKKLEEEKKKEKERKKQEEIYNQIKEFNFRKDNICKFGKYKGEEFSIVFNDKSYIKWALKNLDMNDKNNLYYLIKLYYETITQ